MKDQNEHNVPDDSNHLNHQNDPNGLNDPTYLNDPNELNEFEIHEKTQNIRIPHHRG